VTLRSLRPIPENNDQRKAVEILRDRNHPAKSVYSETEIQWAVAIIQKWEPNHPLLRYRERQNLKK
jgi:hypothetical protein